MWPRPKQQDMARTGVSPNCRWQSSMVTRRKGTEDMTCPNKDLTSKGVTQKGVICVPKWSQYTVMWIPKQAINHQVEGIQALGQDTNSSFEIQGERWRMELVKRRRSPKYCWSIYWKYYQCRNSGNDGKINAWNVAWGRHLDQPRKESTCFQCLGLAECRPRCMVSIGS